MKSAVLTIAVMSAIMLCTTADAQNMPKRKPGLWEAQMATAGSNMPNMEEILAKMSPEQRAQMEAAMKQRGMSFGPGGTNTVRFCLSEQDAADDGKALLSRLQRDASQCEHKVVSRSATDTRIHAVCKTEKGPSEFNVHVYDVTPVSMSMEMDGKLPERGDIHMQQKAHWVSSDCGTVK